MKFTWKLKHLKYDCKHPKYAWDIQNIKENIFFINITWYPIKVCFCSFLILSISNPRSLKFIVIPRFGTNNNNIKLSSSYLYLNSLWGLLVKIFNNQIGFLLKPLYRILYVVLKNTANCVCSCLKSLVYE